ncbi:uncharacterized protein LOC141906149 isoform X3 [Tubulanus polymorphus]|uniref:uncharacterized protein LOC141906149 isoform X3 n=1 Tax=Tubulanus polymorphus TaxID=672921 RepID=UPI003DA27446
MRTNASVSHFDNDVKIWSFLMVLQMIEPVQATAVVPIVDGMKNAYVTRIAVGKTIISIAALRLRIEFISSTTKYQLDINASHAVVSRDDNVARQDVSRVRPLSFYRQATDLRWTSVEFIEEIETRPEPSAPKENLQNNEPIKGQIIDKDVYDQQPIITDVLTPVSDDNRRFVHESIENLYQNETSNVDRNQCFLYERYPSQYQQFAYYYESD